MKIFAAITINSGRHENLNNSKVIFPHAIRSLRVLVGSFNPKIFKT